MQQTAMQSIAYGPQMATAPDTVRPRPFGFPRAYVVTRLRDIIAELLYIGADACRAGFVDQVGDFTALDDTNEFDGPDFTLALAHDLSGHQVLGHCIEIRVAILMGCYQLQIAGHSIDIPFLPSLDTAQLTTTAHWIIRNINKVSRTR